MNLICDMSYFHQSLAMSGLEKVPLSDNQTEQYSKCSYVLPIFLIKTGDRYLKQKSEM